MTYKAKIANRRPATTLPRVKVLRAAPEVVCTEGVEEALTVPFEEAEIANVVDAGMARVVAPAFTTAGAVPTTRAAAVLDPEPVRVVKATWGTVTTVLIMVVVLEPSIVDPALIPVVSVAGRAIVV